VRGPVLTPDHDLAGKVLVNGLPPGQQVFYKDPNGPNVYADSSVGMLGPAQRAWLKRELAMSRATWKVIANDLPLGLVVPDGTVNFEGVSQGDNGHRGGASSSSPRCCASPTSAGSAGSCS
jgi:alkaline phosphatase D